MGKFALAGRLAARDIRRHPAQAVLLLLAITAATTVLTLGLALHGVTSQPYQQTRAATNGPDVVAYLPPVTKPGQVRPALPAAAATLTRAAGVTGHGGPYPVVWTVIRARGLTAGAETEGRLQAASAVDQPKLTAGRWVRPGQVVIERTFAEALGVGVGDRVTLDGRAFTVGGIAVTAAAPPYPNLCYVGGGGCMGDIPAGAGISPRDLGFVWVTEPDALGLATPADPVSSYVLDLKLSDPARAQAFAAAHGTGPGAGPAAGPGPGAGPSGLVPWTGIATADGLLVLDEQQVLSPGALLAVLLAVASVAVLAGGRMAEHTRRTGLLKAVGAGPGLVAAVFLAENLLLALASAAAGLAIGRLAAPLITSPGAALIGTPGAPSLTLSIAAEVVAVAVAVALAATLVPAIRAARTSTISALAGTARTPRRRPGLIAASRHLPVPLLIGLRLVARRTRRALLGAASITVTTAGIVAVLAFHVTASRKLGTVTSGLSNPVIDRDEQMLLVLTVVLVTLTVLNAICAAWTTVLDTRAASALARALGATPRQVGAGIAAAQVIPAVPGALLGVPLGIGLYAAAGHSGRTPVPPAWWLAAAVLGTVLAVAALASVPALAGTRRPVAEILQAETA